MSQNSRFEPTTEDIERAYAHLGRMISRGANPQLDADGLIHVNGPVLKRDYEWAKANRDAFRAALVGSKRHVPGTLERIYGFSPTEKHIGDRQ